MWSANGEGECISPEEIQKVCRTHLLFKDYKKLMDEPVLKENGKEIIFVEIIKKHEDGFLELVEFFDFVSKDN